MAEQRSGRHSELLDLVVREHAQGFAPTPVFIEVGAGGTTVAIARLARDNGAIAVSCDTNREKVERLRELAGSAIAGVRFVIGDSLDTLPGLCREFERVDLLFLDGAASALQTLREFQVCEDAFGPGSVVVIDNATLPDETEARSSARKGKILVPYLLASPWWIVSAFPDMGDSMIVATRSERPEHADPEYEWPDYRDPWEERLEGYVRGELGSTD